MKVRSVTYTRTKQVRPYEPERIELTIDLNEGDTVQDAMKAARRTVAREFGETPAEADIEALEEFIAQHKAEKEFA